MMQDVNGSFAQLASSKLHRSKSQGRNRTHKIPVACRAQPPTATTVNGNAPTKNEITLVVMGAERVGKSALVSQFLWGTFVEEYRPTVEEFNWIEYDAGGNDLVLQVIDTSGSRDFIAMRTLYVKTSDAFIVVSSASDPASFLEAQSIVSDIQNQNDRNAPVVLATNKVDEAPEGWRPDAEELFAQKTCIPFIPVCAKDKTQVLSIFNRALEGLQISRATGQYQLKKRRQSMPTRRPCSRSSDLELDVAELQRIAKRHNRRDNCTVS